VRAAALLAATLALGSAVSAAPAAQARSDCDEWQCGSNGLDMNGINLQGLDMNGVNLQGLSPHGVSANTPAPARAADPNRLRLRAVRPAGE
jgi:hypothetical protein